MSYEEALKFQEDNKLDYFLETSAKNGDNVKEIFGEAVQMLYIEYIKLKKMYNSSIVTSSMFSSVDTKNSSNSFRLKNKSKKHKESNEIDNSNKSNCLC